MTDEQPDDKEVVYDPTTEEATKIPQYDGIVVEGFINPLAFFAVDEPWKGVDAKKVTEEDLLDFLCQPDTKATLDAIVARYRDVSKEGGNRIFVAPTSLLNKLVWPLRNAKGSYALGNYFGTIALCGMVAEMAALLIFEARSVYIQKHFSTKLIPPEFRKYFKGDTFEREGQQKRVQVLNKLRLLNEPQIKDKFDLVRDVRRRYLHLLSHPTDRIEADAAKVFLATVEIVRYAMGLDIRNGKVAFRPEIFAWMEANAPAESKTMSHSTLDPAKAEE